ncbi:MAG: peptide ABC transporter substrate-binding protein [Patescibacteria group bacterium]|nr:peptide ABC transporter substrate-binding protein [Patescibacteria group bacterium]
MKRIADLFRSLADRARQWIKDRKADQKAKRQSGLDKRLVLSLSGKRIPSSSQLKHLSHYLSAKDKTTIRALAALIMVCLIVIGGKYITGHIKEVPANGGEYVEASVGGPRFVNPILASTNDADLDIVKLVFSGLVRTDHRGNIVPDLAESFDISEDGKTYTFILKSGVNWHDGAPFTSDDVLTTVSYIRDPSWKSPLAAQFANVTAEATDERTVTFHLEEPFAPFLSLLTVGILPSHLWQEVLPENAARAELNIRPIGTGPFRFKKFEMDKQGSIHTYTLTRNEDYHEKEAMLSTIRFVYHEDFQLATDALIDKRVDGLSFLPLEFRETVEDVRTVHMYTLRLPQYTAVFFNQSKNPLLESRAVRQALALTLDKELMLSETIGYNGVPVHSPILPGFVGFHAEVKKYRQDLGAAAELLEDAGWKMDEDGVRTKKIEGADGEKVDTPLALTLTTADAKENITVAQIIKAQWESIGVQTELEIVPSSKIQKDKIRPRDYDALLYGEIIGPDPDPYPFWHSSQNETGGLNLAVFSNRRVDELLEQARASTDEDKRRDLYREFQDILAENVPAIFLYSPTYTYAVDRKVQGIETSTIFSPADRFTDAQDWYMKTKKVWK